jgi:phospholipase C
VPLLTSDRFVGHPKRFDRIVDLDEYYEDLRDGRLPQVAYIAPAGSSEHPPGRIGAGEALVKRLLTALSTSSAWGSSAFMWTYDDWGGWYDHVPPPRVDQYGLGFRAPALLVSAWAKRGYVDSTTLDFTSQLKFIEHNWSVDSLARRDAQADNFLSAFDFDAGPREPVLLDLVRDPAPPPENDSLAVYACYGAAILIPFAFAGVSRRRRRLAEAMA